MAPDYKTRAKRKKKKKKKSTAPPGWVWLVGGLLGGLLIGFGGYALIIAPTSTTTVTASKAPPPAAKPLPSQAPQPSPEKTHFDFYTLLPKMEVVIPDSDIEAAAQALPKKMQVSAYMLQTGSFQQFSDADAQKAELALLGIEADIETVVIKQGETWHRVRMGPYTDMASVKAIRRQLKRNNVDFMLLKLGH